jgi:hypothetical protein
MRHAIHRQSDLHNSQISSSYAPRSLAPQPQPPSAGSLAHNQPSTIDPVVRKCANSQIPQPCFPVHTLVHTISLPIATNGSPQPAARFRRSVTVVFTKCTNCRYDRLSDAREAHSSP